jgi:hypothetical protein
MRSLGAAPSEPCVVKQARGEAVLSVSERPTSTNSVLWTIGIIKSVDIARQISTVEP